MDSSFEVNCPYCGEGTTLFLDPSQSSEEIVVDCEVCCRPMELAIHRNASGETSIDIGLG